MKLILLMLTLILGGVSAMAHTTAENNQVMCNTEVSTVADQSLPSEVIDAIVINYPGFSIRHWTIEKNIGKSKVYIVTLSNINGEEMTIAFDKNGKIR